MATRNKRKTVVKKAPAKKPVKKAVTKVAAKKGPAKRAAAKKPPARKAVAKKAAAKKSAPAVKKAFSNTAAVGLAAPAFSEVLKAPPRLARAAAAAPAAAGDGDKQICINQCAKQDVTTAYGPITGTPADDFDWKHMAQEEKDRKRAELNYIAPKMPDTLGPVCAGCGVTWNGDLSQDQIEKAGNKSDLVGIVAANYG